MSKPKLHWELPSPHGKAFDYGPFCGLASPLPVTQNKRKVTCMNCRKLMKLHDHLRRD